MGYRAPERRFAKDNTSQLTFLDELTLERCLKIRPEFMYRHVSYKGNQAMRFLIIPFTCLLVGFPAPSRALDCKIEHVLRVDKSGSPITTKEGFALRPLAQDYIDPSLWEAGQSIFVCPHEDDQREKGLVDVFNFERSERLLAFDEDRFDEAN
jgi:hypothetical protein